MKYFEAFGEGGFHSAFMTTYAFGSLAFEDIPFPKLRGAGLSRSTIYRKIAEGTFPPQIKISTNGAGWKESRHQPLGRRPVR